MNLKNILFIWIPKIAGTSMFHVFEKYGCRKLKYPLLYRYFDNRGFVTFDHINIFKLVSKNIVSQDYFHNAFKFAFVRNPWDRLVSLFFFKNSHIEKFGTFTNFVTHLEYRYNQKENFFINVLNKSYDLFFHNFKYFHKHNYFHRFNRKIEPVGLYNVMGLNQANPQVDWICNEKGKLVVDFLGRFENLESDFEKLSKIIGIKEKLPQLRKSDHKDYRSYYKKKTKKIVEKIYAKDIELFDYQF